jgi:hypothetical protein
MAHCFDIHKSDKPCPHAPPEKQKHVLCVIIFELKVCGMQGLDSGKFIKVGTLISSLKWLGNFHITSL